MPTVPDPDSFKSAFADVRPLVLEEWPELDPAALDGTEGDLDAVVALVADATGRTRAMSRRQLGELLALATHEPPPPPPAHRAVRPGPVAHAPGDSLTESLESLVTSVEAHLEELTREVKRDVAPLAADTAREHLGLVLLITAGVGFVAGLFLGALGYPHDDGKADGDT